MNPANPSPSNEAAPILTLIQQMKDGSVHPNAITKEQRLGCVEVLASEGYSVPAIAQIVQRSEKTIKRDLVEVYAKNCASASPTLAKQLIGRMLTRVEAHQARLMRLARGNEGAVSERAQAEYMAWQVEKDKILLLQSLGYLPQRPKQVIGDIVHHRSGSGESDNSFIEEAEKILQEVQAMESPDHPLKPEVVKQLAPLKRSLEREKIKQQAESLREAQLRVDASDPEEAANEQ